MTVIVRFAPSPTGHLHLGGARTALFNWLYARQAEHRGEDTRMILRLEDTDRQRSREIYAQSIPEALSWLGLTWDGEVRRQSDRRPLYLGRLDELERSGKAYRCYCEPSQLDKAREMARAAGRQYRYPRTCRDRGASPATDAPYVLRLRVPDVEARPIMDRILGLIPVSGADLDDFVLTRSDGSPLYNLCCVVDDAEMGVTQVIRGADHVDNTRRQALIYDALGLSRPEFAHLPLVAGLSKREGSVSVLSFRDQGFLPEALVNYIARLGWSCGDREVFDLTELLECFRLDDVGHSPAKVNVAKLLWLNEKHLHRSRPERLADLLTPWLARPRAETKRRLLPAIEIYKTRCRTLIELAHAVTPCMVADDELYLDPAEVALILTPEMRSYLLELSNLVGRIEPFERHTLKSSMWEQLAARGMGFRQVAPACRLALIGTSAGPRLLDVMIVLGSESVVSRLRRAAEL